MPLIREYGLIPGRMPPGPRNTLADVPGVAVGHRTVRTPGHNTGVTVILPRADIYLKKCHGRGPCHQRVRQKRWGWSRSRNSASWKRPSP